MNPDVEMVLVDKGLQTSPQGELGHLATFTCRLGSLTVVLWPDWRIAWTYTPGSPHGPQAVHDGADVTWRYGRLVASGQGARGFWEVREHLGLSLGQIEAELREMSGYRDEPG